MNVENQIEVIEKIYNNTWDSKLKQITDFHIITNFVY